MDGFRARVFLSYIMNLNSFQREVKKKNWLAQHKTMNHVSQFSSITVNTRTCCCKAVICVYTQFHIMLFSLNFIPHMHLHDLADTPNLKFLMEGIHLVPNQATGPFIRLSWNFRQFQPMENKSLNKYPSGFLGHFCKVCQALSLFVCFYDFFCHSSHLVFA